MFFKMPEVPILATMSPQECKEVKKRKAARKARSGGLKINKVRAGLRLDRKLVEDLRTICEQLDMAYIDGYEEGMRLFIKKYKNAEVVND